MQLPSTRVSQVKQTVDFQMPSPPGLVVDGAAYKEAFLLQGSLGSQDNSKGLKTKNNRFFSLDDYFNIYYLPIL